MHRLLCAWPPPEADRDCRQRKHLQTSHNGWMENGMDPLFWLQVFQKGSAVETSWTPPHKEKFSRAICLCLVRVRKVPVHCCKSTVMFSCTLALGRLATAPCSAQRPPARRASWWGHARPGQCPGVFCEGWTGSPTVNLRGWLIYRGLSSDRAGRLRSNFESFFKINFPFLWKMCDLWFSIRN